MVFTACDDNDTHEEETPQASVVILHASEDAPKVDVKVNDDTVLEGVDFTQGSGLLVLDSGINTIVVDGILPGNERATVIGPVDLDLVEDTRHVIIAANSVAQIEAIVVTAPEKEIDSEHVRVQVVHATAAAPEVDVYVTAPDAEINASSPLGTFGYKGNLGPVEVPSGDYQIRVTPKDTKDVVFDSGSVPLAGGSDLVIAAVPNTKGGDAPIQLVVLDGTSSAVIADINTPASVRVIHDSPDAPAVDIVVNDNFAAPLVESLIYPEFTPYVNVPAGTYNIKVAVADTQTAVINADLSFAAGSMQSVYAVNTVANIEPLVLMDDSRSVATEAKVRLVHGSPTAGSVDIYVTAPNADITGSEPAFSSVPFKADTGYLALAEGDYQVRVTPTGSKTAVIDTGTISVNAGGVYTAVARDADSGAFGLILLDDFNN
jgi:hypothetical protein